MLSRIISHMAYEIFAVQWEAWCATQQPDVVLTQR